MKKSVPQLFFLLIVLMVTFAFLGLISNFLLAIFWAIVFAVLFYERYEKIKSKMPHKPNLSAGLTLGYILLIVIIPLTIVSVLVVGQASSIIEQVNENNTTLEEQVENIQEQITDDNKILRKFGLSVNEVEDRMYEFVESSTRFLASRAVQFTQDFFNLIVEFFLMLYVLFFFLRDGKRLVQELIWVLPIGDQQEIALLRRFESVAKATVKGSLLVALTQGLLGGILFWILGIDGAFLWGVIMVIASLLPVGSALVWAPWAGILFYQGEAGKAIILVIIGAGFIGLVDNFMRPRLVGQDTKMPDYLILLSTLGGLAWFGLSGFVIGPIIAALFVTCWQMLGKEYGEPHDKVVTEPTAEELASEIIEDKATDDEVQEDEL